MTSLSNLPMKRNHGEWTKCFVCFNFYLILYFLGIFELGGWGDWVRNLHSKITIDYRIFQLATFCTLLTIFTDQKFQFPY